MKRKPKAEPASVYSIRIGEELGDRTLHVVGFAYPPASDLRKEPRGTRIEYAENVPGIVVATGCVALIGRSPRTYGWPVIESGFISARTVAEWINENHEIHATVVQVADWPGGAL